MGAVLSVGAWESSSHGSGGELEGLRPTFVSSTPQAVQNGAMCSAPLSPRFSNCKMRATGARSHWLSELR